MNTLLQKIITIQKQYWTNNKDEKALFLAQFPYISEWKNILRLHHLLCMELFHGYIQYQSHLSTPGSPNQETPVFQETPAYKETMDKLKKTTVMLLSDKSPYVPQKCEIKFDILTKFKEFKKLTGTLLNASLSHLGSLEVLRLDTDLNPISIDFIPFSHIKTIMHNADGTLISYKDKKEKDVCYIAPHYYLSEESVRYIDNTGTDYICKEEQMCKLSNSYSEKSEYCKTQYGIGCGPQEFMILHNKKSIEYTPINKNAIITIIPHMYEMDYMKSTMAQSNHMI